MLIAAAPAAPLVGEAAYLLVGLAVVFTWVGLVGLYYGYGYSLGAFLRILAGVLGGVPLVGGRLANAALSIDHHVKDVIAGGIEGTEKVVAKWWHAQVWVINQVAHTLSGFGADIEDAIRGIVTVTIPSTVGAVTGPVRDELARFRRATAATVNHELQRFARGIDSLQRDIADEARARVHGIDRLSGQVLGRVNRIADQLRGEVADLERYVHGKVERRVGKLERALAGGLIAAGALALLQRVIPWSRCTNVGRVGRHLCGMDTDLLESLLLGGLALGGLLSVRTFAEELRLVEDEVGGLIFKGVKETRGLKMHG
jgi:hypothetical protein